MNEIKVAENKTLKLTNVVARRIAPEELGNMMVALTQLQNFIKSHNAQPIGPLVQALKIGPAPEHAPELYLMQQATQLITQTEQNDSSSGSMTANISTESRRFCFSKDP